MIKLKKLMSINYSRKEVDLALLILRLVFGLLMMSNGYRLFARFNEYKKIFTNIFGIGSANSLKFAIFADFFCPILLVIGLFTRLATIPLIFLAVVFLIKEYKMDIFGEGQIAVLYLGAFITILILGPGKTSIDSLAGK
jgi:putative oxidoreductase